MCGNAGAFGVPNASTKVAKMLKATQHRGQEGVGIVSAHGKRMFRERGLGLVAEVFKGFNFEASLPGDRAIGHVRYPTSSASVRSSVQPYFTMTPYGKLALGHNGTITNCRSLATDLALSGELVGAIPDTEMMGRHIACNAGGDWTSRLRRTFGCIEGAYSVVALAEDGTALAAVDPYGFRPLMAVRCGDGYLVASETAAFAPLKGRLVGEPWAIAPGTIETYRPDGRDVRRFARHRQTRYCSFELVYFARPDSIVYGLWGSQIRRALAERLAARFPQEGADLAVGVPNSASHFGLYYAQASGLHFDLGISRNNYAGRVFITPGQAAREEGVREKFNVDESIVRGRSVVVVDDSLIRGTTSRELTLMLRRAGAREVHWRIPSPLVPFSCHWGIATHEVELLVASRMTEDQICGLIGADSLRFQTMEDYRAGLGDPDGTRFCYACFDGESPVPEHEPPCADCAGCADG
ncbi:MAG: amidophosphoribosyltransferase [Patescibacteria group bacterium]|nr:amidophosphoribosyltransferase [Patescibacteria group bacterium]